MRGHKINLACKYIESEQQEEMNEREKERQGETYVKSRNTIERNDESKANQMKTKSIDRSGR